MNNSTPLATFLRAGTGRSDAQLNASNKYADPGQRIGIEFELEDWGSGDFDSHWATHSDQSLRNGVEFVFARPKMGQEIETALDLFVEKAASTTYSISERTSTHIHMDMSDGMTVGDVRKMFILTYLIEPAMFRMADENRKWCGYCQPLTDMQQQRITTILTTQNREELVGAFTGARHVDKYYGFNLAALNRHTTIEFRYFPGYPGRESVDKWINMVQEIKLAARSLNTVEELLAVFISPESIVGFLTANMPRSVSSGLLEGLVLSDCVKRAGYINAVLATSDIPTAALHARMMQIDANSAAARMLSTLFNINFDDRSQRTDLLRSLLRNGQLSPDDLQAMVEVVRQIGPGVDLENILSSINN